jgi:DNA-binding XRE family transcriptional regulator
MDNKGRYRKIEDMMIEKRLTPAQLAKKVGLSTRTVYAWKNGEAKPTLASAYKLAKYFGVDPRVFLD